MWSQKWDLEWPCKSSHIVCVWQQLLKGRYGSNYSKVEDYETETKCIGTLNAHKRKQQLDIFYSFFLYREPCSLKIAAQEQWQVGAMNSDAGSDGASKAQKLMSTVWSEGHCKHKAATDMYLPRLGFQAWSELARWPPCRHHHPGCPLTGWCHCLGVALAWSAWLK